MPAGPDERARRVEAMVARHSAALVRVANQFSLCHDDALDAYQRALEIYLRRLTTVDPATEGAWLRVVVKHEAMAIRRSRQDSVGREDVDLDASVPASLREVEDEIAGGERIDRSAEALRALKPDEARALLLKAEGMSYEEIGRRFGWTYTKVNRSITEGRARFLKAYRGIEAGEACERHEAALRALAAGTATSAQVVAIRPHLRHCAACRAAMRELARLAHAPDRAAAPARLARTPARAARAAAHPRGRQHRRAVRGVDGRRAARPGGDPDRPVPERRGRRRGVRGVGRAPGAPAGRPCRRRAGAAPRAHPPDRAARAGAPRRPAGEPRPRVGHGASQRDARAGEARLHAAGEGESQADGAASEGRKPA